MEPAYTKQISCGLLLLVTLPSLLGPLPRAAAQYTADSNVAQTRPLRPFEPADSRGEGPNVAEELIARQVKRQREEHQKQVFSDTARLLQLATDLKAQVDHNQTPTPGALKDVDEIGKVARRLSEYIKTQ